jgi:protein involved in polysaccharide export with SLBB domain
MALHQRWWCAILRGTALSLFLCTCGCVTSGKKPTSAEAPVPRDSTNPADLYTLACPDLISVEFDEWHENNRVVAIGTDGCVDLGELGRVHVEGDTVFEAAQRIAAHARIPFARVSVHVAEHQSRQVYLFIQGTGSSRSLPYRGPETVLEVLRRAGELSPAAAPKEIYILRSQVADSKPAEVLTIDLEAIRTNGDHRTDHHVQPQDEIYVSAKPGSAFAKAVPPILMPAYEMARSIFSAKR